MIKAFLAVRCDHFIPSSNDDGYYDFDRGLDMDLLSELWIIRVNIDRSRPVIDDLMLSNYIDFQDEAEIQKFLDENPGSGYYPNPTGEYNVIFLNRTLTPNTVYIGVAGGVADDRFVPAGIKVELIDADDNEEHIKVLRAKHGIPVD